MFKTFLKQIVFILLILIFTVFVGGYFARNTIEDFVVSTFLYDGNQEDWEFYKLRREFKKGELALTDAEMRETSFTVANTNSGTRTEITANTFIARQWSDSPHAKKALQNLQQAVKIVSIDDIANSFQEIRPDDGILWHPVATNLIERIRQNPEHTKAPRILCDAALMLKPDDQALTAPDGLLQIAEMIQNRYSKSPELSNFCEVVCNLGNPTVWTTEFEPYVRNILDVNEDRFVRCSAHFALAGIVRSGGINRQNEAKQLYLDYLATFDGKTEYQAQPVEELYRHQSENILKILNSHGLGMPAPETSGIDLDGNELSLESYRGKVVLVSFWASWCAPCIKSIPHEKDLLEKYGDSNFTIFGMNADKDINKAIEVREKHGITWKSLQTIGEQAEQANNWTVEGYPTFILLNRNLEIEKFWTGLPPLTELNKSIQQIIAMD